MKIKRSELVTIIKEAMNEISMDTLKSANDATYKNDFAYMHFEDTFEELRDFMQEYADRGSDEAQNCLNCLERIIRFVERKTQQAENFGKDYANRYDAAHDRMVDRSRTQYGKSYNDMDYDELEDFEKTLTDDDEIHTFNN